MWSEGFIKEVDAHRDYMVYFSAKVYDEPSEYGIYNGRLVKLKLKILGEIVCDYDRGWKTAPTCPAAKKALRDLLYMCDGMSADAEISYE